MKERSTEERAAEIKTEKTAVREIAVIGGDSRQLAAAVALSEAGYRVCVFGIDAQMPHGIVGCATLSRALRDAQAVVLPLPITQDGEHIPCEAGDLPIRFSEIIDKVHRGTLLFGGYIPQAFCQLAEHAGIPLFDYYKSEELIIRNAHATAEGAVAVAISNTDTVLGGTRAAIVGYGRIGRILARLLRGIGVSVTVYARSEEALAWALAEGCLAEHMSDGTVPPSIVSGFGVIFNTVPEHVIGRSVLQELCRDTLLIELASKPGGFAPADARDAHLRVLYAQGLPGRYAPVSAGQAIAERIDRMIKERL